MLNNKPPVSALIAALIAAGFGIPLMNRLYGALPAAASVLIILAVIILLVVLHRKNARPRQEALKEELGSDIRSIELFAGERNFVLRPGERFSFGGGCEGITSCVSGGVWILDARNSAAPAAANAPEATITFPARMSFESARVTSRGGAVIARGMSAADTSLKTDSGSIECEGLYAKELKIECGSGRVFADASISGGAAFSCADGNISVRMKNTMDEFNIDAFSGGGTINAGGLIFNGANRSGHIGAGALSAMELRCGTGDINVEFRRVDAYE